MPLSAPTLSAALRTAMLAAPAIGAVDGPALTALCDAIASTVVQHIVTNAVVSGTCTVTTTGTATAQSGGGPITGTVA